MLKELQAQVEHVFNNPTQLICAGLEEPGTDAVWTCGFSCLDLLELVSHLGCSEGQVGAGEVCVGGCGAVGMVVR